MAQAITDVKTFLEDARKAVVELAEFEKQEETLAQEEKKRRMIRRETMRAREGKPAHIMAKMNSLCDQEIIAPRQAFPN